jgi:hypothetical protein
MQGFAPILHASSRGGRNDFSKVKKLEAGAIASRTDRTCLIQE